MSVKIVPPPDDRAERMLADPDTYFAEAREQARLEVEEEMQREREARRRNKRRWSTLFGLT